MTTEEELKESNKHLFNGFIEVLKAYMEGKTIQYLPKFESYKNEWKDINNDCFNDFDLGEYFYRVKPDSNKKTTEFSLLYHPIPSKYKSITFAYDEVLLPPRKDDSLEYIANINLSFGDGGKEYEKLIKDNISDILANKIPDHSSVIDFANYLLEVYPTMGFTDISIQPNEGTFSLGFFDDKTNVTMDIYFDFHNEHNFVFECEE